ncbi:uncharacterized protein PHALS_14994 [Plasmopara halstedii]|uniref:Uncharacterized protein n=1 Tax=Plasmopara halstedii TaxID=4781 RepID=A0A0P1B1E4_PLAHL|nr:uncharacterized protein PHALS_14994 [Plasmopara halstedii]CEG47367.1 hypothetical protein PHALS_14994 [Plasmopara halstedii]|eukprot:XP_024583736.1 hypothetical protein PHALS_14994 [Plasmopara halstedii]
MIIAVRPCQTKRLARRAAVLLVPIMYSISAQHNQHNRIGRGAVHVELFAALTTCTLYSAVLYDCTGKEDIIFGR